ncbi:MAG: HigA family addiction module antitoxin [Gammaproteobacteria bacterium]|nr:HigA family addiction module antitoxin [Gammaproteobacteria bacterium]
MDNSCNIRARLLNGRLGISPEMAIRLSKAFGGSSESWLQQQMQYDLRQVQQRSDDVTVGKFTTARRPSR